LRRTGKNNLLHRPRLEIGPRGDRKPFHYIIVHLVRDQEKSELLGAGVEFKTVTQERGGEAATFEIGEEDPRWEKVSALISSFEGKLRVQDVSMARPTLEDSLRAVMASFKERLGQRSDWLDGYSGQTVEQLLSLEGRYRIDSLVLAFEQAILRKVEQCESSPLTDEERVVLAVEALEREVNNGGYEQFFTNSSREFTATIVESLQRIGCRKTAGITRRAIKALGISDLTA
jgi:hypothetical protein